MFFARSGITNEIAGTAQHVQAESYSQYEDSSNSDILTLEAYKNISCDNQKFQELVPLCVARCWPHLADLLCPSV